jgi:signal transduction histidine kinase
MRRRHGLHALAPVPASIPATRETDTAQRGLVRMALDLHDGPLQDLAAVGFTLCLLQRTLAESPGDTSRAAQELAEVQRQLGAVEANLRAVAANSDPTADASTMVGNMLDLIDAEVAQFKARRPAEVEVDVVGDVEPATASQRIVLHRVMREALSNVARHTDATEVRIGVFESKDVIYLRVTDNGSGFDPDAQPVTADGRPRLGLAGMRRRVELLDGTLSVESRPGGPTSITVAVKRWRPAGASTRPQSV